MKVQIMRERLFQEKYILSVSEAYQENLDMLNKDEKKPATKTYDDVFKLLHEGVWLGATKFGDNFII